MPQTPESPRWIFDALPPSGQRRGGDPSEYAFNRTLDTFVREALQNANDQSLPHGRTRAEVHFDLQELTGSKLEDFLTALGWKDLARHLRGAADVQSISKFRNFADAAQERDRLTLLRVEDRYTTGLVGDETEGSSNFRALCRDSLLSHKKESSGGSYGLGKSVYWAFSEWATVLFHSCLDEDGPSRHRLIGRVELPSHETAKASYAGPGWFGRRERATGGERAVSLWDDQARELARHLHMTRPSKITGTTILVVGFRDPTDDEPRELPELLQQIRASAARFFWPAMNFPKPLRIVVGGEPVAETSEVAEFADTWRRRAQGGASLEKPGDVVRRTLQISVPRLRKEKGSSDATECDLLVRLADPSSTSPYDNRLAVFRGPGMVVKYFPIDQAGTLPRFHAILACGEGRTPEDPTPSDRRAEAFLRKCEPPGHDEWSPTPRLRDDYVKGGGASLTQLFDAARKAIRELLLPQTGDAQRGPELLQRRFPLGSVGDPTTTTTASPFNFRDLAAVFTDGRWEFSGTVEPALSGHAWTAAITLKMLGEDGGDAGRLKITDFELRDRKGIKYEHSLDGAITLSATRGVEEVVFSGHSETLPSMDQLCELGLEITGELHSKGGV